MIMFAAWMGIVAYWLAQPRPQANDPILYQINTEPQSLILQADGLVNHE